MTYASRMPGLFSMRGCLIEGRIDGLTGGADVIANLTITGVRRLIRAHSDNRSVVLKLT